MSNYPDGVTGREPAIAGYDEGTLNVECDGDIEDPQSPGDYIECPFSGDVDVVYVDRTTAEWECPVCGETHEEELDDGVDPDAMRDAMYDY